MQYNHTLHLLEIFIIVVCSAGQSWPAGRGKGGAGGGVGEGWVATIGGCIGGWAAITSCECGRVLG